MRAGVDLTRGFNKWTRRRTEDGPVERREGDERGDKRRKTEDSFHIICFYGNRPEVTCVETDSLLLYQVLCSVLSFNGWINTPGAPGPK